MSQHATTTVFVPDEGTGFAWDDFIDTVVRGTKEIISSVKPTGTVAPRVTVAGQTTVSPGIAGSPLTGFVVLALIVLVVLKA